MPISPAHLGRLLADAGLSFQRTRTWKASPDPDYELKAARVLELKAAPPAGGGHVIAFDQMGPISLRPMAGAGWAVRKRPERQRATYHKRHGTRYVFGAYDLHEDRLRVRLRQRRRGSDNLQFMAQIRSAIPSRRRIYWIQDGLSANWTPDIRAFAAANKIELVPTPTYASYLNPVECHFFPIGEFVVNNADYVDWDAFAWALARHVQRRNGPHRDKRIRLLEARHQIAAWPGSFSRPPTINAAHQRPSTTATSPRRRLHHPHTNSTGAQRPTASPKRAPHTHITRLLNDPG